MTAERWLEIQAKGGAVCLSNRSKWLITGSDRVRYLNGQVTQDVRLAKAKKAVYACVTDARGRICGDVFIRQTEDGSGLLLDAEASLREELGARLERYLVADDAEITDVTEDWALFHFFGAEKEEREGGCDAERLGVAGMDLWVNPKEALEAASWLTPDEIEITRVLRRLPRYPNELNGETFPPEAGLEARAMDYAKGCYIGQEVLSRIKTTRKMPRELVFWALNGDGAVTQAMDLASPGGRVVGRVTSVVVHPETGLAVGLAYVKLGAVPDDSQLLVGNDLATIERLVPGLSV